MGLCLGRWVSLEQIFVRIYHDLHIPMHLLTYIGMEFPMTIITFLNNFSFELRTSWRIIMLKIQWLSSPQQPWKIGKTLCWRSNISPTGLFNGIRPRWFLRNICKQRWRNLITIPKNKDLVYTGSAMGIPVWPIWQ